MPQKTVYIGRGKNSIFGNPFPMKSENDRLDVCIKFGAYLKTKVSQDPNFANEVKQLRDKNLVCFCNNGTTSRNDGGRYCHGLVLLACADYLIEKEKATKIS